MRYPAVRWNERRRAFLCPDCDADIEMKISEDGTHYTVASKFGITDFSDSDRVIELISSVLRELPENLVR